MKTTAYFPSVVGINARKFTSRYKQFYSVSHGVKCFIVCRVVLCVTSKFSFLTLVIFGVPCQVSRFP